MVKLFYDNLEFFIITVLQTVNNVRAISMPKLNISIISSVLTYNEFFDEFTKQINVSDINTLNDYDKNFYNYRK